MKIHEYQAKAILARYGVTTPRGEVVFTKDEAREAAHRLRSHATVVVVKAQIHAGGRGKGGGVKLAKDADEAADLAKKIIGMTLVTHQTGPEGRVVRKVLIEEALNIDKELYLGITLDRRIGMPVVMASKQPRSVCSLIKPARSPLVLACRAKSRTPPSPSSRRCTAASSTPMPRCSKSILACSPATENSSRSTPK